jgi:glycosyltransferase involved in cell wall biosynthesis
MRIGVVARRLSGQPFGIGRYMQYLLEHWNDQLETGEEVVLFTWEELDLPEVELSDAFRVEVVRPRVLGTLWENALLPPRARGLDVLFGPSYTIPLTYPGRTVVATHSVNERWEGAHEWWYDYTYSPLYRLSARKADRVITPLESTKRDVAEHYGVPPEKISVAEEGASDIFRPLDDPELLRETRLRWLGEDRPYVLFVGKMSRRRNIPSLVRAFARVKHEEDLPHALLLFGRNVLDHPLEEMAEELGIEDSLVQTDGEVDRHEEVVAVYNAADLYVYPSSYDGFSVTLVEAMACGLPVVTVDRAAMGDIAGGHAVTVDEPEVDQLAAAMRGVLTDPDHRDEVGRKCLERSKLFTWRHCAQRTLDVLREVASGEARRRDGRAA